LLSKPKIILNNARLKESRLTNWKKTFGINLIITLVGVFGIGAIFEVYLRIRSPHIASVFRIDQHTVNNPESFARYTPQGKRLIPNVQAVIKNHPTSGEDVSIRINEYGFRGENFPQDKPKNEIRILLLEDSITMSAYLNEEDTWPYLLEKQIGSLNPQARIRVINTGVNGIGLRDEVNLYSEKGRYLNPDLVLLGFYLNDSRPPWGFPAELNYPNWWRRNSRLVDTIYRNLVFKQWIQEKGSDIFLWAYSRHKLDWRHDRRDFLRLAADARHDWGAAWHKETWPGIAEQVERLLFLVRENNVSLALVIFPVVFQVDAVFFENTPQRMMRSICQGQGIPILDLLPVMRQQGAGNLLFDQCHPNRAGNRLIAKSLTPFLQDLLKTRTDDASGLQASAVIASSTTITAAKRDNDTMSKR